jgi:hypothetical protein
MRRKSASRKQEDTMTTRRLPITGVAVAVISAFVPAVAYALCTDISNQNVTVGTAFFTVADGVTGFAQTRSFYGGNLSFAPSGQEIGYLPTSGTYVDLNAAAAIGDSSATKGATVEIRATLSWYAGTTCTGTPVNSDFRSITKNTLTVGGASSVGYKYYDTELLQFTDFGAAAVQLVIIAKINNIQTNIATGCFRIMDSTSANSCQQ